MDRNFERMLQTLQLIPTPGKVNSHSPFRHGDCIQFSSLSPLTRPKSFTLFVTITAPRLRA